MFIMSLTKLAQTLIKEKFDRINYAVDATCGNGHDTLFLANLCKKEGMVYSFDVQEEALDNAEKLINDYAHPASVMFVNTGHENMEKVIKPKVNVVMFNLGFLPNSDSNICTKPETTIPALESALNILREGGMLTVLCYPGTEEGRVETDEVVKWLKNLDKNEVKISKHLSEKPDETTPVLYVVGKR